MLIGSPKEKKTEEKSGNLEEQVVPTCNRSSIEDEDLEKFIAARWIEANDLE